MLGCVYVFLLLVVVYLCNLWFVGLAYVLLAALVVKLFVGWIVVYIVRWWLLVL